MLPKALAAGAPPQTPNSEGALSVLASLIRRGENGVNAVLKWVPFTPKCSQKLSPGPPMAKENAFVACQSDTQGRKWYRVNAIQKMGSIHTQMLPKALAAGAPPQTLQ